MNNQYQKKQYYQSGGEVKKINRSDAWCDAMLKNQSVDFPKVKNEEWPYKLYHYIKYEIIGEINNKVGGIPLFIIASAKKKPGFEQWINDMWNHKKASTGWPADLINWIETKMIPAINSKMGTVDKELVMFDTKSGWGLDMIQNKEPGGGTEWPSKLLDWFDTEVRDAINDKIDNDKIADYEPKKDPQIWKDIFSNPNNLKDLLYASRGNTDVHGDLGLLMYSSITTVGVNDAITKALAKLLAVPDGTKKWDKFYEYLAKMFADMMKNQTHKDTLQKAVMAVATGQEIKDLKPTFEKEIEAWIPGKITEKNPIEKIMPQLDKKVSESIRSHLSTKFADLADQATTGIIRQLAKEYRGDDWTSVNEKIKKIEDLFKHMVDEDDIKKLDEIEKLIEPMSEKMKLLISGVRNLMLTEKAKSMMVPPFM